MSADVQRDDAVPHRRAGHRVHLTRDVLVSDRRALVEPKVFLDGHRPAHRWLSHSLTLRSAPRNPQPKGRRAERSIAWGGGSWTVGRSYYARSLSQPPNPPRTK